MYKRSEGLFKNQEKTSLCTTSGSDSDHGATDSQSVQDFVECGVWKMLDFAAPPKLSCNFRSDETFLADPLAWVEEGFG